MVNAPTMPMPPRPSFESIMGQGLYSGNAERTFIDKVLAKADVDEINSIMENPEPTKAELNKLVALVSGGEVKLLNFDRNDQYINGKYFVWIEEVHKIIDDIYDYEDIISGELSPTQKKELKDMKKIMIQNTKFMCSIFHFMTRSSLSHKAAAFDTLTTTRNEKEYVYGNPNGSPEIEKKKKFLGVL